MHPLHEKSNNLRVRLHEVLDATPQAGHQREIVLYFSTIFANAGVLQNPQGLNSGQNPL